MKGLSEAVESPVGHGAIIPVSPALQRLRIIEPEARPVIPRQAAFLSERGKARLVEEATAGEDVSLDEIRVADIAVEQAVIDRDELKRSTAARPQVARDGIEIGAPPAATDGLDHLDRGDCVKLLGSFAIVLEADLDLRRQSFRGNLLLGPGLLLC